ncbi:GNAT family N-acetyltransferase [Agrococcus casei]|uniref:GCN5-related N-acetyltransferase n=1 Tax=Agrococcus casei LMG 22410 TaxID=1255656 RepID=A0A1R4FVV5_9MICO|nr:GNAT family N-acetyltransferase [Agrococcus casei]SJM60036.1 GCN5-related N-acetyltransferase [Agrococcus casei LMG 22410]
METIDAAQAVIREPAATDAERWDEFIVAEQAAVYRGVVPDDFAERQRAQRDRAARTAAFAHPSTTVRLIAEIDGELVGAVEACDAPAAWERSLGLADDAPADRELGRLYVSERARGTGLAAKLMDAALGADDAYLWIIDGNERAKRFYARRGFVDYGESVAAGPSWGGVSMRRMVRRAGDAAQSN